MTVRLRSAAATLKNIYIALSKAVATYVYLNAQGLAGVMGWV